MSFFCRGKTGKKVIGLYVVFFWENWEKSQVCMCFFAVGKLGKKSQVCMSFFCRPKTGKKVIGLYVVFYAVQKLGKKS